MILDTAEELFAEQGVQAVSLREINVVAGFSIAALHYHFSTRDGVLRALLERSQPAMYSRRSVMIEVLMRAERPAIEDIVDALVRPMAIPIVEDETRGTRTLRFLARLYFDRAAQVANDPADSLKVFLPLLRRALPHLDDATLIRRWLLTAEFALHALGNKDNPYYAAILPKASKPQTLEQYLSQLTKFLAGGLTAA